MTSGHPADHVVLVGMMGSGKSVIAPLLARRLGRPALDLDALVEARSERTIAELFAHDGEAGFRAVEAKALAEVLTTSTPSVIAAGGGVVVDPANRALLSQSAQVVWLRARPETLARRLGGGEGRPLLSRGGDLAGELARLLDARDDAYRAAADLVVDVDEGTPEELAEEVARVIVRRIPVELGARRYPVLVGPGARHELASLVPGSARRAVLVSQEGIDVDLDAGIPLVRVDIGPGEQAKTFATVERLCRSFVTAGLTRSDVVVALGGGVVTDVAGFAAACYHRGTAVVHVATSLLAQVDAAIGGKTGVNLPEGKNLAGAFWQPEGVICDTDTLASLPEREWRSGLGEMAKYAFLGVDDLGRRCLTDQVARCAAAKAAIVGADERESGQRMLLNYGHTLAHALEAWYLARGEANADDGLRHGEAVGLGLLFAGRLAHALGRIDAARLARHAEVVRAYGLPESLPAGLDPDELLALMGRDKKALGGGLTFVLDGPCGLEVVNGVDAALVRSLLEEAVGAAGAARNGGAPR
jgi:5-deoxy-5-amino-3-dehydroquinate synthase